MKKIKNVEKFKKPEPKKLIQDKNSIPLYDDEVVLTKSLKKIKKTDVSSIETKTELMFIRGTNQTTIPVELSIGEKIGTIKEIKTGKNILETIQNHPGAITTNTVANASVQFRKELQMLLNRHFNSEAQKFDESHSSLTNLPKEKNDEEFSKFSAFKLKNLELKTGESGGKSTPTEPKLFNEHPFWIDFRKK